MKEDSQWMSISDMMSGLMLVFMFIAISFMIQIQEDKAKIENIAKTYYEDKEALNKALKDEFKSNLSQWEAEISKDNIITFNSPRVLFKSGKSLIQTGFKEILDDFFPRYIQILSSSKYKNEIDEIRIEGHTSNVWSQGISQELIYLKNMKLSQDRANNVLSYCYSIKNPHIHTQKKWLERHFRANGMAFSKMKYLDKNQTKPDIIKSKRVEFRVQMKTEEKIYNILKIDTNNSQLSKQSHSLSLK
jgi:outer membrane protein OmpA-like peptidoglycan-associated protein